MPSTTIPRGNIFFNTLIQATLTPASVADATSAEQTFSVKGLITTDVVFVQKPTAQAGLGIVGSRVSANDVLAITFMNATAATITPTAAQVYIVNVIRQENPNPLPTAIV